MRVRSGVHIILGFVLILLVASCQSTDNNQLSDDHRTVLTTPNHGNHAAVENSIVAIDTHFHVLPKFEFPAETERYVETVAHECEEAQVRMVIFLAEDAQWNAKGDPLGINESLKVAEMLSMREKPIQAKIVAACDPNKGLDEDKMKAVKAQFEEHRGDIVGFKCYTGYHGGPMDPGYQPFYRLAVEYDLPVIFHTGVTAWNTTDLADSKPLLFEKVAQKYPDMRIVLAHMGWPWHIDAAMVALRHPNVWVDLAGLYVGTSKPLDEMVQGGELCTLAGFTSINQLVEGLTLMDKYDRVLYGTDFPYVCQIPSYRKFIEALIPKEHHIKVF